MFTVFGGPFGLALEQIAANQPLPLRQFAKANEIVAVAPLFDVRNGGLATSNIIHAVTEVELVWHVEYLDHKEFGRQVKKTNQLYSSLFSHKPRFIMRPSLLTLLIISILCSISFAQTKVIDIADTARYELKISELKRKYPEIRQLFTKQPKEGMELMGQSMKQFQAFQKQHDFSRYKIGFQLTEYFEPTGEATYVLVELFARVFAEIVGSKVCGWEIIT